MDAEDWAVGRVYQLVNSGEDPKATIGVRGNDWASGEKGRFRVVVVRGDGQVEAPLESPSITCVGNMNDLLSATCPTNHQGDK